MIVDDTVLLTTGQRAAGYVWARSIADTRPGREGVYWWITVKREGELYLVTAVQNGQYLDDVAHLDTQLHGKIPPARFESLANAFAHAQTVRWQFFEWSMYYAAIPAPPPTPEPW